MRPTSPSPSSAIANISGPENSLFLSLSDNKEAGAVAFVGKPVLVTDATEAAFSPLVSSLGVCKAPLEEEAAAAAAAVTGTRRSEKSEAESNRMRRRLESCGASTKGHPVGPVSGILAMNLRVIVISISPR